MRARRERGALHGGVLQLLTLDGMIEQVVMMDQEYWEEFKREKSRLHVRYEHLRADHERLTKILEKILPEIDQEILDYRDQLFIARRCSEMQDLPDEIPLQVMTNPTAMMPAPPDSSVGEISQ